MSRSLKPLPVDFQSSHRRLRQAVALLCSLLIHALFFCIPFFLSRSLPPPPLALERLDPKKLSALKENMRSKKLLLSKKTKTDPQAKSSEDAQAISDQTLRVQREQVAQARPETEASSAPHSVRPKRNHDLRHLGVPLHLDKTTPSPQRQLAGEAQDPNQDPNQTGEQTAHPEQEQYLFDRNLPVGSETLLNAQESIFYSFYARIYQSIGPIWRSRLRAFPSPRALPQGEYVTSVDVVLDPNGNLLEVRKIQGSGVEELDRVVFEAWNLVGPFPHPPRALIGADQRIHTGWSFRVQIQPGFGLQLSPPRRNY
ncbi:MAG: TonB C-terminal domain-containing protein [Bdellovibrionia bacterium]